MTTSGTPEIGRLLAACEQAQAAQDWERLSSLARLVLEREPENGLALGYRAMANRRLALARPMPPPLPRVGSGPTPPPPPPPRSEAGPAAAEAPSAPLETVGAEPDAAALLARAQEARGRRDWREMRRYARAALALSPGLAAAQLLIEEADRGLSAESLAAIQAAAHVTEQTLARDRRRSRLGIPIGLPRFGLPALALPGLGGAGSMLSVAGAAALFVVAGLAAFVALSELNSNDGNEPDAQVAGATFTPGSGGGGSSDDGNDGGAGGGIVGDDPNAPAIEALGCRQLDDGATLECQPTIAGEVDRYAWSIAEGLPTTGDGEVFRTFLPAGGPYRVALEACSGDSCAQAESQAFVVAPDASTPAPAVSTDPGGSDPDPATPTRTAVAGPEPEPPSIVGVACAPSPAAIGETASCGGSYGGGSVQSYDWSVNGVLVGTSSTFSIAFQTSGARTIALQVCNSDGCDSDTTTLVVEQGESADAPVINVIGCIPTAARVNEQVQCEPTVTGEVDRYDWTSGTTTSTQPTFTIAYNSSGTRTIRLEVCNGGGCDTAEASIAVSTSPTPTAPILTVSTTGLAFGSSTQQLNFTISNGGGQQLNFQLSESLGWLELSSTSGSVTNGGRVIRANVERDALAGGQHSGVIAITSNGGSAQISVTVVKNPTLTTAVSAGGGGTVSPETGVQPYNDPVDVIASPAEGYRFGSWGSGACAGSAAGAVVLMDGDKTCTATFIQTFSLALSVTPTGAGTTSGQGTWDSGTDVVVSASPNAGWTFDGWTGADAAECDTGSVTLTANYL